MLIGHSPAMLQLIKVVTKVAKTDANILITGENGTGKEMLAREIHRLSSRNTRQLLSVDMGAISESLFESELFGHERGAFTDVKAVRVNSKPPMVVRFLWMKSEISLLHCRQTTDCTTKPKYHPNRKQQSDSR